MEIKIIYSICLAIFLTKSVMAFIPNNIFGTGDTRLFDIFCVSDADELEALGNTTMTHDDITWAGIRRSIIGYFNDKDPDFNLDIDSDINLSDLYQLVYGNCTSPINFIKAAKDFSDTIIAMDYLPVIKDDPRYHFDAEFSREAQAILIDRHQKIISAATTQQQYDSARSYMGKSLHAIQKFYSHSNWIEMENSEPNFALATPGSPIGDTAGPTEDTCSGNHVITEKITSGYNTFHNVDGENITFPDSVNKCHHGGSVDFASNEGINKDAASPCFSPGYTLHQKASEMAVRATEFFINSIRYIIGDGNFAQLFNLGGGSALAIVIDTTGSMADYIDTVKKQVADIIHGANEAGVRPSVYLLVPYGDPSIGPATKTTDPDIFLDAVNSLEAGVPDSGGDGPEMFWGGLLMALSKAPRNTDIICFTDAVGKDGEKMESVKALAKESNAKVSIITSLISKEWITTVEDYQQICTDTGGLFIPSNNVDIDAIVGILSKSFESAKATIALYSNLTQTNNLTFPIDNFWMSNPSNARIEVKIPGLISTATLSSPSKTEIVNMLDESDIENSELDFEVFIRQDGLLYFSFSPNEVGFWELDVVGSRSTFSVNIEATCTFSLLSDFRYLDTFTSHPSLRIIPGEPITGSLPVIAVILVASSPLQISALESIALVDKMGSTLLSYPKQDPKYEGAFMIQTGLDKEMSTPLPQTPFFLRLQGKDSEGNMFWRMLTSLIEPSTTQVDVTASSANMEGKPGDMIIALFVITNHGVGADIVVDVLDGLGYLNNFSPAEKFLSTNESFTVTAEFFVPLDASVGTESQITVSAQSQLDLTSNYALATLKVISDDLDFEPPICQLNSEPSCGDVSEEECQGSIWSAKGWVSDAKSGLQSLRVDIDGKANFTKDEFSAGFQGNVSFDLNSNCCNRKAKVVAIDQKGNAGFCNIDLGGFLCSSHVYCHVSQENFIDVVLDVDNEYKCKKLCSDFEGCQFYSWFSDEHDFPLLPTPKFSCILLSSCEQQLPCDVCFSGPSHCCSSQGYCHVSQDNFIDVVLDVDNEYKCKKLCSDFEGCQFYSWFSDEHDFPLLPTPKFSCILLSSCDQQLPCDVCFSGPSHC